MQAAAGLAIAGAATSAYGQYQAGKATAAADKYNASLATANANIAEQNAQFAAQEGEQNAATEQLKGRAKEGAIIANQGASGVEVGSGSFADVDKSARELSMLDVMTIRSNAARKAYGYQVEAAGHKAQANLDLMEAKHAKEAGAINAAGTLLGGLGNTAMYSNYMNSKSAMPDMTQFNE